MTTPLSRVPSLALRIGLAGLCCVGIWQSWKLAQGDYLFRKDNADSIREAIRIVPDSPVFYMRLSQYDPDHARDLLQTALGLNRYNAPANIELALTYEADGDTARAEKLLLDAFTIDHTYISRWSLANFYFRRDDMPDFWVWAKRAAEMPSDNVGPLFALCWRAEPDAGKIADTILTNNPDLIRQFANFLLTQDQIEAAATVAPRLARYGNPNDDLFTLYSVVNGLLAGGKGPEAQVVWKSIADTRWVPIDQAIVNNPKLDRTPLPVAFDWAIQNMAGVHPVIGPDGLNIEISGDEPETVLLAGQAVVLKPGKYTLDYSYRTNGIAPDTGIQWKLQAPDSDTPLVSSTSLSSQNEQSASVPFTVPDRAGLYRLLLVYNRALGTTRVSGTLVISSVQIYAR